MSTQFTIRPTIKHHDLTLTACVGFLSIVDQPEKLLVIKNNRGWDIPGGHIEADEKPYDAFKREVFEESGCNLLDAQPIAVLVGVEAPHNGILVYEGACQFGEFNATDEVSEVRLMSQEEFLGAYFGDKVLISKLLDLRRSNTPTNDVSLKDE